MSLQKRVWLLAWDCQAGNMHAMTRAELSHGPGLTSSGWFPGVLRAEADQKRHRACHKNQDKATVPDLVRFEVLGFSTFPVKWDQIRIS